MYIVLVRAHSFTFPVSEDVIPDFEVGRVESVGTTILCNPRIPISEPWLCTAICGTTQMLNNLNESASVSAEPNANAIIQLPLLTDRIYYCVVNATTGDDTVTELRGRLMFSLSGMYMYIHVHVTCTCVHVVDVQVISLLIMLQHFH